MWHEPTSPTFLLVIGASVLAHVASLALMPTTHAAARPAPPMLVAFEAAPPPPPPPPPPVAEPAPPPPAPERLVARAPRPAVHRALPTPPAEAPPPPSAATDEPPADLSGVTLTNEAAGWSTPIGDGTPMTGPIATGGGPRLARGGGHATTTTGPTVAGDRVVALGDLSRPPRAPDLDGRLAANYPREARRAGLGGSAVVRVRILADGRVGPTRVVSETRPGFGVACQHTLVGSRWQAPLDGHAAAVATDLAYTCTFSVET